MTKRTKYYTPSEVSIHNTSKDLWVSFLGKVYDLTSFLEANAGFYLQKKRIFKLTPIFLLFSFQGDMLLKPLIDAAGQDISHWFDAKTGDLKKHIDPNIACPAYYTQHGRFSHVPPPFPTSDWANDFGKPWWKNDAHYIGVLSQKTRFIKIKNALTLQNQIVEVMNDIFVKLSNSMCDFD